MANIAHESMHDLEVFETRAERAPGLVVVTGAVLVFVVSAVTFALGQADVGIAVVSCGMLIFGAGLAWLAEERRRVREVERDLLGDRLKSD